ncbi:translation initiation factor IF-3 [Patescibacteria group bacterium]|nr:translation initiation factor IF-3 [Patescibacteria group bacterium]
MRIHRHRHYKPKFLVPEFNSNEKIKAEEVRVIDPEGKNGVMKIADALARAQELGLDLVEVSPKANPPVCKIIDHGAFKYQKEKEIKKQRAQSKEVDIKGIRLTMKIGAGDLKIRENQALKFLEKGQKLRIELIMRGREKAYRERGENIINTFVDGLREHYEIRVESPVKSMGGRMHTIIARNS